MQLIRHDAVSLRPDPGGDFPIRVFANAEVPVERSAVNELRELLTLQDTVNRLREREPAFFDTPAAGIRRVVLTPDFHKGRGIPIGTVLQTVGFAVPQAIGNDVNCGMRLYVTDLPADAIAGALDRLEERLRHIYFLGGRQIPMCREQRHALLARGLPGVMETHALAGGRGLWSAYDPARQADDLRRVHRGGALPAAPDGVFDNYLGGDELTFDSQIGSIGGGNHFVELQRVARIFDGAAAHAWGLRAGQTVIMIHSGSVMIGHQAGARFLDLLRRVYPAGMPAPENGIYPLPESRHAAEAWQAFWSALGAAANFAFGNRLFLGLMMQQALREIVGDPRCRLLYDAPHNLAWREEEDGIVTYVHRKGACPARGALDLQDSPFAYTGEPVLVPGSMGAPSFILAGEGNRDSLCSASHGAGRSLSRGDALHVDDGKFRDFLRRFRIVTPADPRQLVRRPEILEKWEDELRKEAPYAFKNIGPVVDTQVSAGIVRAVAQVEPLLTVKG